MKYIFLFFVFPLSVWSQSDAGLQLFGSQWQGNNLLPVYRPAAKWTISLPGWQHNLSSNSLRYGDVITTNASGNPVVDVGKLLDHLKDQNALAASVRLQTFQLTHSNGPLTFSIGHQFRYWNRFDFPEALPKLIWEGNGQYIGQTVPFGFNLEMTTFSEWSAGLAYSLNSNWTAGARLKYLSGIGHVGTSRSHLSLYTDPEVYQLTVDADFQVDAAGYFQYDDFDNLDFSYRFKGFEQIVYPGNTGFAADLGLSYSGDQWETNLSLVDLGNIQWKKDAESYLLKGQYAYDGLNVARDFFNDSLRLEDALDTLQNLFDVQTQAGAFKTALPARLIWNAQYNLSEQLALSAGF